MNTYTHRLVERLNNDMWLRRVKRHTKTKGTTIVVQHDTYKCVRKQVCASTTIHKLCNTTATNVRYAFRTCTTLQHWESMMWRKIIKNNQSWAFAQAMLNGSGLRTELSQNTNIHTVEQYTMTDFFAVWKL